MCERSINGLLCLCFRKQCSARFGPEIPVQSHQRASFDSKQRYEFFFGKSAKYFSDSLEFGFKLAEIAKKFTLWVHTKNHPQFEMISIVPEILSRNCEQLAIFNDCYTSTFSDLDIEKIIEVSDFF